MRKPARGTGASAEKQSEWARQPQMMQKLQQAQAHAKEKQAGVAESPATR